MQKGPVETTSNVPLRIPKKKPKQATNVLEYQHKT
jgi:hypothetical protein